MRDMRGMRHRNDDELGHQRLWRRNSKTKVGRKLCVLLRCTDAAVVRYNLKSTRKKCRKVHCTDTHS